MPAPVKNFTNPTAGPSMQVAIGPARPRSGTKPAIALLTGLTVRKGVNIFATSAMPRLAPLVKRANRDWGLRATAFITFPAIYKTSQGAGQSPPPMRIWPPVVK